MIVRRPLLASSLASSLVAAASASAPPFAAFHDSVKQLFGPAPRLDLLLENSDYPFAHEAAVFMPRDGALFLTSNRFTDKQTGQPRIQITRVTLPNGTHGAACEQVRTDHVPMANGGTNYRDGVLFCAQGTVDGSGGLAFMEASPPYRSEMLLSTFHNRPLNSPNDVVVHSDGSIWFTDPAYGYEQGFRPRPRLPPQVYRWDPRGNSIRAVADGFGHPNGIAFSPDEKTVYVSDTDWVHGDGSKDDSRAHSIYAFDIVAYCNQPFLVNKRLFAMTDEGIPDGIKCDTFGNVYSGSGDGISIWSPGGVLLGKILVDGGVSNFCFGRDGEMFLLGEHRLWRAQLAPSTKGALMRM